MKQHYIALLAACAALAACTETSLSLPDDGAAAVPGADATPLQARFSTSDAKITRAPREGTTISTAEPVIANVIAYNQRTGDDTKGNYLSLYHNGTMVFTETEGTPVGYTTPRYYPNKKAVFLVGLYPNNTAGTDAAPDLWTADQGKVSAAFDGKTDLMASKPQRTTKAEAKANDYKTLTFQHLLTKLIVRIKGDNGGSTRWGKVTGIQLLSAGTSRTDGLLNTLAANPEDVYGDPNLRYGPTNPTFSNDPAKAAPVLYQARCEYQTDAQGQVVPGSGEYKYTDTPYSGERTLSDDTLTVAYSIVQPINAATQYYYLQVQTEKDGPNAGIDWPIKIDKLYAADGTTLFTDYTLGKQFIITLIFANNEIKAICNVVPWDQEGITDVNYETDMVSKDVGTTKNTIQNFKPNEKVE